MIPVRGLCWSLWTDASRDSAKESLCTNSRRFFNRRSASQSINLDGGGSSIMLIQEPGKEVRAINSPSGKTPRPVPVMLGVRKRIISDSFSGRELR